jgi:predicted HicB family RNase H-like nuclease
MIKKVAIKKPGGKTEAKADTANQWVSSREGSKRLTIDVPVSLHSRLKIEAVKSGMPMADLVRQALERVLEASGS